MGPDSVIETILGGLCYLGKDKAEVVLEVDGELLYYTFDAHHFREAEIVEGDDFHLLVVEGGVGRIRRLPDIPEVCS